MSSAAPTREVIPPEIDQHRVAWLTTEGRHGYTKLTRVRFATDGGKIYTSLRSESVALRQILERAQVRISLGRGNARVKGPEILGLAFLVAAGEMSWARHLMARK
jgi:general stress protein 26